MTRKNKITGGLDALSVLFYLLLISIGWLSIFAAIYEPETAANMFDLSLNPSRQLIWIVGAFLLILIILNLNYRSFETFAYLIYILIIFLLIAVLFLGTVVNNSRSWIAIGAFRLQPAEFAKFATALALAKYLSSPLVKIERFNTKLISAALIALPALLIILQGDTGSALVFSIFVLVLYREGLPSWMLFTGFAIIALFIITLFVEQDYIILTILIITLGFIIYTYNKYKVVIPVLLVAGAAIFFVISVSYFVNNILKEHQRNRVMVLVNPELDPLGVGWNVTQSKIAIGSGGLWGKGFLKGTQTKLDYVPEQSTDFIFCTIGEERGWMGSLLIISLFTLLLTRIIVLAERQKDRFVRIYGYSVASVLFFHFAVNIGMTIGLFPVIGIPLPFVSYGGSSLWSFSILLFIFLKLDSHRNQQLMTRY